MHPIIVYQCHLLTRNSAILRFDVIHAFVNVAFITCIYFMSYPVEICFMRSASKKNILFVASFITYSLSVYQDRYPPTERA